MRAAMVKISVTDGSLIVKRAGFSNPAQLFSEIAESLRFGDYRADIFWVQDYCLGEIPRLPEMINFGFTDHTDLNVLLYCKHCRFHKQIWPIPDGMISDHLYGFNPTLPFFAPRVIRHLVRNFYKADCCQSPMLRLFFHLSIIFDPDHLRIQYEAERLIAAYPRGI